MIKMIKNRKTALFLTWNFTLICMIIIFCFSNQTATDSSEMSGGLIKIISELFGVELSSLIIRKTAHAIEFGGLCFAFNMSYFASYLKFCPLLSLISTVFYATSDEIHQYFVDGRACQVRDVFVDFCGALIVTAVISVIYFAYLKFKSKREV